MRDVILVSLNFDGGSYGIVLPLVLLILGVRLRTIKRVLTFAWRMCTIRMHFLVTTHEKNHWKAMPKLAGREPLDDLPGINCGDAQGERRPGN